MTDLRVSLPAPCTEDWEEMRPQGCNRHCTRCETVIHDLSQMTLDEAEALLASNDKVCVRAKMDAQGVVELKVAQARAARRMIATVGASLGLLAASGQAAATERRPSGVISGTLAGSCTGEIVATAANGQKFTAKVRFDGRYKLKHLPAGTYELEVPSDSDGESWRVGSVVVQDDRKTVLDADDPEGCIIIGQIRIDDSGKQG